MRGANIWPARCSSAAAKMLEVSLGQEPHLILPSEMAEIVTRIVEIEGPIHAEEIARRRVTALCGLQRTGPRIVAKLNKGISLAVRQGTIIRDGSFCELAVAKETVVRDRSLVGSPTLRKPQMLPSSEICIAVKAVVEAGFGARREEAITQVSRLLGFKATSAQLRDVIDREVTGLIEEEVLSESHGVLHLA